jgi:hypothetical protein
MASNSINESPVTYERVTGGAATATIIGKNFAMKQWKQVVFAIKMFELGDNPRR